VKAARRDAHDGLVVFSGRVVARSTVHMTGSSPERDSHDPPLLPGWRAIGTAFQTLTILGSAQTARRVDASAVYYPVVGLVLGLIWVLTDRAVSEFGGRVAASAAVLLVATVATRARGLLALGRLAAALPGRRADRLARLESGGRGATGCALLLVVAELTVLCALDRFRLVGLAFAPLLGCCAMVVLAVGSRAARPDGRRLKFAPEVGFTEFGAASAATFALVSLTSEFLGLLLVLSTAVVTVGARVFFHRWLDGVNETAMFAAGEAVQLITLALLAAFS
jgi:cobalamin synthase